MIPNENRRGKRLEKKKIASLNRRITPSCLLYMFLESWKKRRGRGQNKMIETIMANFFSNLLKSSYIETVLKVARVHVMCRER